MWQPLPDSSNRECTVFARASLGLFCVKLQAYLVLESWWIHIIRSRVCRVSVRCEEAHVGASTSTTWPSIVAIVFSRTECATTVLAPHIAPDRVHNHHGGVPLADLSPKAVRVLGPTLLHEDVCRFGLFLRMLFQDGPRPLSRYLHPLRTIFAPINLSLPHHVRGLSGG